MQFRINKLVSNAGDAVALPAAVVTAIVGGNNVGKSQLLRDIRSFVYRREVLPVTITELSVTTSSEATEELAAQWLATHATRAGVEDGVPQWVPVTGGIPVSASNFIASFTMPARSQLPWLSLAAPFFLHATSPGLLANYAAGSVRIGEGASNASPLAQVYRDGDLEAELNRLSLDVFGQGLLLDRANSEFRLRVGEVSVPVPPLNHPTREYADALLQLPLLDEQGDGLRSFYRTRIARDGTSARHLAS